MEKMLLCVVSGKRKEIKKNITAVASGSADPPINARKNTQESKQK